MPSHASRPTPQVTLARAADWLRTAVELQEPEAVDRAPSAVVVVVDRAGTGGGGGGSAATGGGGGGSNATGGGGVADAGAIWRPDAGTTWQWQLIGTIDTTVAAQMFDIDLFDAPQVTIDTLHGKGIAVICYFSAGSSENWRPDFSQFPDAGMGNGLDGWPGERWLDTRNATVRSIMEARLDLARTKHCDGVEPDNVDAYENDPGFPLTAATQLDYDGFLATQAHARGLSVGLKNDVDQATILEPQFDWTLNEQCHQYDECDTLSAFVAARKAVFNCEYQSTCPAHTPGFSTILKGMDLDAPRTVCP